eukprot:895046-Prorocentrum_minimum.AAC.2
MLKAHALTLKAQPAQGLTAVRTSCGQQHSAKSRVVLEGVQRGSRGGLEADYGPATTYQLRPAALGEV